LKTVEREMTERHYKRKKVKMKNEKKGYDQARALGPSLILEKLSSTGETCRGKRLVALFLLLT